MNVTWTKTSFVATALAAAIFIVTSSRGQAQTNYGSVGGPNAQTMSNTVGSTGAGQTVPAGQVETGIPGSAVAPGATIGGQTTVGGRLPMTTSTAGRYQPYGQSPWFMNASAQQQLRFNQNQLNQLNQNYRSAYDQFQAGVNQLNNLPPTQVQKRYAELYRDFRRNLNQSASDVITDPQQLARFQQLNNQYQAYDAFTDPVVQQRLNLTDQQLRQLGQYRQVWANELQTLRNAPAAQREAAARRFSQLQSQVQQNVNQVLSDPQERQIWAELYGQPGDFGYETYFGTDATGVPNRAPYTGTTTSAGGTVNAGSTGSTVDTGSNTNPGGTGQDTVGAGTTITGR